MKKFSQGSSKNRGSWRSVVAGISFIAASLLVMGLPGPVTGAVFDERAWQSVSTESRIQLARAKTLASLLHQNAAVDLKRKIRSLPINWLPQGDSLFELFSAEMDFESVAKLVALQGASVTTSLLYELGVTESLQQQICLPDNEKLNALDVAFSLLESAKNPESSASRELESHWKDSVPDDVRPILSRAALQLLATACVTSFLENTPAV